MHPYSINVNDRIKIIYLAVPISLFFGWLINNYVLNQLEWYQTYSWIADVPSSGLAIFGLTYKLFDTYLWRWFAAKDFMLDTPDLSGTYEGELYSSRDNKTNATKITLTIEQTLTKIKINLFTSLSSSRSEMASIHVDEAGSPLLVYEFINDHQTVANKELTIHRGLTRLSLCRAENQLSGTYYTSHHRGNFGEIRVKKL